MKFVYLSLVITFFVFVIFMYFNKKDKILLEKIRNSLMEAVTFTSGLMLFLYLFGKVTSIEYFSNLNEESLLFAILVASVVLMSVAGDKYYTEIKKRIKKIIRKRKKKNGK